jgi:hypothetical protein
MITNETSSDDDEIKFKKKKPSHYSLTITPLANQMMKDTNLDHVDGFLALMRVQTNKAKLRVDVPRHFQTEVFQVLPKPTITMFEPIHK